MLDYLCHHCYTKTARAFVQDTAVKHLDADGDEIMQSDGGETPGELSEALLERVELREREF